MIDATITDALQAALDEGRGSLIRDTESGQLLLNLNDHADVAEYLFWINTFSEQVYRTVWGDKDTFAMAFGVAGKAHLFMQNEVSGLCRYVVRAVCVCGKGGWGC